VTDRSRWTAAAVAYVAERSGGGPADRRLRVTLNFHPDRRSDGMSVLEQLARDLTYRSQFETGTSNGGLTAFPGGDRTRWEQRIFGHAYDDAPQRERPKYGALNHRRRSVGGAPRFGSCHLRLAEHVLDRTTFCFPDSTFEPRDFGTAEHLDLARLADAFDARLRIDRIEAKEGGGIGVVLDPCYRGTNVEEHARVLPVDVEWHEGRRLPVDELRRHPEFRGPRIVEVGTDVAEHGWLDARILGSAVAAGSHDPQELKKVWHHVARFGRRGSEE